MLLKSSDNSSVCLYWFSVLIVFYSALTLIDDAVVASVSKKSRSSFAFLFLSLV